MQTGWGNLPAGASDDQYEIGGLEIDRNARFFCLHCQRITDGLEQAHRSKGYWFWCSECNQLTDLPDPEEDIDDYL